MWPRLCVLHLRVSIQLEHWRFLLFLGLVYLLKSHILKSHIQITITLTWTTFILIKYFKWRTFQLDRLRPFLQDCCDYLVISAMGMSRSSKYTGTFQPKLTCPSSVQILLHRCLLDPPASHRVWGSDSFLSSVTLSYCWVLFYGVDIW